MSSRMRRQYVKLCDIEDFDDPAFLAAVRSILPERDPLEHIERKVWEFAMLALVMEEVGQLDEHTEALSVGAGDERIVFWLANRIGRVVATDIYGTGDFSGNEADPSMLDDPAAHAPFPYREDRLEVLWMNGRELRFPDDSFDIVFTLSSIEHFGSPSDVARCAREIGRVLRPGGYAVIVTDCLVRHHPLDRARVQFAIRLLSAGRKIREATPHRRLRLGDTFTPRELETTIVEPSGLRLIQPLDLQLSPRSWENVTIIRDDATLVPSSGEKYPHILVASSRSVFTSVCLVLEKPRS
jgi:SAM-dependent methyltransferase